MKKKMVAMILAVTCALGVTACGAKEQTKQEDQRKDPSSIVQENQGLKERQQKDNEQETLNKRTSYPLTITTYGSDGAPLETTYEKAPEKVLAVYQGSIETMLALGLEDHIVATAGLDNEVKDDQKAAFSKTNYLDEFTPSLETVTMLQPDMIVSWGSLFQDTTLGSAKGLVEKGMNIYMNTNTHPMQDGIPYNKTLENEYTDILNIGKIFDVQDRAEAIVNEMKQTIATVQERTKEQTEKPSVLILESRNGTFTNYGSTSLAGDMVTQLGGVLKRDTAVELGKEDVIAQNPDVIFVVYMPYEGDDPEQVKQDNLNVLRNDQAYQSLDAVKNNRIVPIMLSEMYASATRTNDGIVTFAKGLYPDITLELKTE